MATAKSKSKSKSGMNKDQLNYALTQVNEIHEKRCNALRKAREEKIFAEMSRLGLDHKSLWHMIKSGRVAMKNEKELIAQFERGSYTAADRYPSAKFIERVTLLDAFDFSGLDDIKKRLEEIKAELLNLDDIAFKKMAERKNEVIEEIILGDNAAALKLLRAFRREK